MKRLNIIVLGVLGCLMAGLVGFLAQVDVPAWADGGKEKKPGGPPPLKVDKNAPLLLDEPKKPEEKKPGGLPPLKINKEAPLLLDEPKSPAKPGAKAAADNQACFVCHANYQDESLVRKHAKEGIGCEKCHGPSVAHRNDEDNITPPDILYSEHRINAMCEECHKEHNVPAHKIIATWQKRCSDKTNPGKIVCSDCHGDHRLNMRTVRWDKDTRKLIPKRSEE